MHINWVRPLLEEDNENARVAEWSPPLFHEVPFQPTDPPVPTISTDENSCQQLPTTHSGRTVKPVDYYGF